MHIAIISTLLTLAASGPPPEYLTEVVGPVHQAEGTPAELAVRAQACLTQTLTTPPDGGSIILSSDPGTGVVVAANALEYRDGLLPWKLRSRITFEGRDGRFRLRHTAIERHNDQSFGANVLGASPWGPVGKWRGSGWQKAEQALADVSTRVATCVASQATTADEW